MWNTEDPVECLLVLSCPVIKVNEKSGRITNGPDSSGMKVWVTSPDKQSRSTKVLVESKGNRVGSGRWEL